MYVALQMSSFLLLREEKGCVCVYAGEGGVPDRMVMREGDKPSFNLTDLGCRDHL